MKVPLIRESKKEANTNQVTIHHYLYMSQTYSAFEELRIVMNLVILHLMDSALTACSKSHSKHQGPSTAQNMTTYALKLPSEASTDHC